MPKEKEYIWHCPNPECKCKGIILFKTYSPYLGEGVTRCSRCGKEFDFLEIMRNNKKNIESFLDELNSF